MLYASDHEPSPPVSISSFERLSRWKAADRCHMPVTTIFIDNPDALAFIGLRSSSFRKLRIFPMSGAFTFQEISRSLMVFAWCDFDPRACITPSKERCRRQRVVTMCIPFLTLWRIRRTRWVAGTLPGCRVFFLSEAKSGVSVLRHAVASTMRHGERLVRRHNRIEDDALFAA